MWIAYFLRCAGANLPKLKLIALSLLIGSIASLGFAPFSIWIAPIIALFALYEILIKNIAKQRLLIAYFFGLGILLPAQQWTGVYVGNLPWIALSLMQACFFVPLALVSKGRRTANSLIFASSLVLSETLMRTIPFTGFGWSRLGFTQVSSPFADVYPYLGVAGATFLIALIASIRKVKVLVIVLFAILATNFVNFDLKKSNLVKVALVQGGVSKLGLDFNSKPTEVYQNHLNQSKLRIKPNSITRKSGNLQNISILFNPDIKDTYVKRYLTPFGEYIPLRNFVTRFSPLASNVTDFSAGTEATVFETNGFTFETLICYELINDVFRDELSSEMLVVQTNNATFGDTAQLAQEREIARVRALETSREIAYVSTTGITSFIDSNGQIKSELAKFAPGVLVDQIQLIQGQTLAAKLRFYPEIASFILLLFLLIRRRS